MVLSFNLGTEVCADHNRISRRALSSPAIVADSWNLGLKLSFICAIFCCQLSFPKKDFLTERVNLKLTRHFQVIEKMECKNVFLFLSIMLGILLERVMSRHVAFVCPNRTLIWLTE